ncbi:pentatricopeptide repeat-containing protein [Pyrus ussuriensis x Pyrus communis]|uniref:Pentatricopeptide repeat-containing protein n=1 Tax=Pyrus ussuriensis x Pyrus communis TaxID=2448454 RepID=A0A5N5GF99_9ROSA|nr:pentatricopeptide repeat-containing protein [Pyrus ussuriensis x Pyrus communis]
MAWHMPWFGLPRLGCLPKMRKLLEFDFSAVVDGAIKDGAAKIRVAENEVSDEQIVECKVVVTP